MQSGGPAGRVRLGTPAGGPGAAARSTGDVACALTPDWEVRSGLDSAGSSEEGVKSDARRGGRPTGQRGRYCESLLWARNVGRSKLRAGNAAAGRVDVCATLAELRFLPGPLPRGLRVRRGYRRRGSRDHRPRLTDNGSASRQSSAYFDSRCSARSISAPRSAAELSGCSGSATGEMRLLAGFQSTAP